MPVGRLLLLRQRRRAINKDQEGSPNSPLTPNSPDCKGQQRFFGSNMTRKRSQNGTVGDHEHRGTKPTGKHKHSNTADNFLNPSIKIVVIISCSIALFSFVLFELDLYFNGTVGNSFVKTDLSGGWRTADENTNRKYDTTVCDVDRKWAHKLTSEEFENIYRYKRPLIVQFNNGAKDWTDPSKWTVISLKREYGDWSVKSGNSREIVRRGGTGNLDILFSAFVEKLMKQNNTLGEPHYVFDRHFYNDSSLPGTLKLPPYFEIRDGVDDSIFFLGSSASGVSFHKHADAWNGVVFGRKRWFLYPIEKTPPGGVYPGFTTLDWFSKLLPSLTESEKPLQCIQEPGEILYVPEGMYHATINLGDTVAVGIQKKLAVTKAEKLFYEEKDINRLIVKERDPEKNEKLLQHKKEIYESLLKLLLDNSEVHMKIGKLYIEQGDLDRALRHTETALKLDHHFMVAVLHKADIHSKLGHVDKADGIYQEALNMNPRMWDVYAHYGDFLINHNKPEEAAVMYIKGIELEPTLLAFWENLKLAQERLGDISSAEQTQKHIERIKKDVR